MQTLVTGGTGWIGRQLLDQIKQPLVVSRNRASAKKSTSLPDQQIVEGDLSTGKIELADHKNISQVVHLLGDSIADGRWNEKKKQTIRDSRVNGTKNLVQSLTDANILPDVVVSASAIGYYGDGGDQSLSENNGAGDDFLADVCVEWERAAQPLENLGVRVCYLRIGIVLGQGGGAIEKMLPPFRLGLGGRLGNGKQWMSWIHLQDLTEIIIHLLQTPHACGPFNGTAPQPVTNSQFTKALGKAVGRPTLIPVPGFGLKLALGEFANFLLASQKVVPTAVTQSGYQFRYPDLDSALQNIIN